MKLSLSWLKEFSPLSQSTPEIVEALTFAGIEIEGVQQRGADFDKVIVSQIESFEAHPNADRLSVCQVNDGSSLRRQVVCGAKNFRAGDKVPLALPGAILPGGAENQGQQAARRRVRGHALQCTGVESRGRCRRAPDFVRRCTYRSSNIGYFSTGYRARSRGHAEST